MKKCLFLPIIALVLLTTFICIGCGAKETPPVTTTATAEAPPVQETPEMREPSESAEDSQYRESAAETAEHEAAEKQVSHEAEARDGDTHRESPEETSEHESAEEALEHESEAEHESAEEAAEHEAEAEHEAAEETAEHESAEKQESHETETETPHESEPEMTEIPDGSVLHLIPEHAIGLIYCPSLLELDYRINTLVTDLIPTDDTPEILAAILAESVGAGFESLAELEEIGLDLNKDFAFFVTSLNPPALSAVVHLKDPEAMKEVIDAESAGSAPAEHNGVTYWNASGADGSFALLENTLVYSQSAEVCESVIDTYKGTQQSIITNPGYTSFLADIVAGDAQLAANFNIESIAPLLTAALKEESESMRDGLEADPTAMMVAPLLTSMFDSAINIIAQLESLSATLEVKGTDVQLAPSLKFKNNSEIQQSLKKMMPDDLTVLKDLPDLAFVNGAFQGNQQWMLEMNMLWLKMFSGDPSEEAQAQLDTLAQQMTTFYESLGEEWGFTANFNESFIPDYLIIYEVKDKQKAETYMVDMFLEQFHTIMRLIRERVGDLPQLGIYDGAHPGPSLLYNDVEIKSFVFPNFGSVFEELPPEAAPLVPEEWQWYYAFHENQLFLAIGSAELIKAALDRKSQMGGNAEGIDTPEVESEAAAEGTDTPEVESEEALDRKPQIGGNFSENPSYQKLAEAFGTDNNLLLALSPMTLVKSLIPIVAEAEPEAGAMMQMFAGLFMEVPETYSIGFSAKVQEASVDAKLLLTLGDFKQAIQMIVMMQQMQQMQ